MKMRTVSRHSRTLWLLGSIALLPAAPALADGWYGGYRPYGAISVAEFEGSLGPYGTWIDSPTYGRVWKPDPGVVGADFYPYGTNGHWVYTTYGWSFESDYPFGWATFHYGRWAEDPDYGWVWVPGNEWAPAWVEWRYGADYVGWLPMGPTVTTVVVERPRWCFVESRYFVSPNVYSYTLPYERYHWAFGVTVPITTQVGYGRTTWYTGPSAYHIATASGTVIHPASVTPPPPGRVMPVHVAAPPQGTPNPYAFQARTQTQPPPGTATYHPPMQGQPPSGTPTQPASSPGSSWGHGRSTNPVPPPGLGRASGGPWGYHQSTHTSPPPGFGQHSSTPPSSWASTSGQGNHGSGFFGSGAAGTNNLPSGSAHSFSSSFGRVTGGPPSGTSGSAHFPSVSSSFGRVTGGPPSSTSGSAHFPSSSPVQSFGQARSMPIAHSFPAFSSFSSRPSSGGGHPTVSHGGGRGGGRR